MTRFAHAAGSAHPAHSAAVASGGSSVPARLGAALIAGALLGACAAPTPVDLGVVPPTATTPVTDPVQPLGPIPITPAPAVPSPVALRPLPDAPAPPLDPPPVTFAPPVSVPEPVLPPVTIPTAPPAGTFAADLEAAANDAQRVVDGYWTRHWGEVFTGTYASPTVVGLYDGTGTAVPTCAGKPLPAYNAVYCVPQDFLAWDVTLLGLRTQIGNSWPYLVVAHEWGHAVQARLATTLNSVTVELQGDCLAGAALYGAVADGTLVLDENAASEIATALAAASDETPWTTSADHGNATERTGAFDAGRTGGVRACLPPA